MSEELEGTLFIETELMTAAEVRSLSYSITKYLMQVAQDKVETGYTEGAGSVLKATSTSWAYPAGKRGEN